MGRKTTNLLAGLPNEVVIQSCRDLGSADELLVTFPNPEAVCPDCGSVACNRKDVIPFRVRHAACMRRSVILSFSCIRYRCRDCGRTFTAKPYWLHERLRMTDDLYRLILLDLTGLLSMSAVARHNCVPVSAVQGVLSNAPCPKPARLPKTLCIDEFKGDSGIWDPKRNKWEHIKYGSPNFYGNSPQFHGNSPSFLGELLIFMGTPKSSSLLWEFPIIFRRTPHFHGNYHVFPFSFCFLPLSSFRFAAFRTTARPV